MANGQGSGNTYKFHPEIAHNIMLNACKQANLPVNIVNEPLKVVLFSLYQHGFFLGGDMRSPTVSNIVRQLAPASSVPITQHVPLQSMQPLPPVAPAPTQGVVINTVPTQVPVNAPVGMPNDQPASI